IEYGRGPDDEAHAADSNTIAVGGDGHPIHGAALLAEDAPAQRLHGIRNELAVSELPDGHHLVVAGCQQVIASGREEENVAGPQAAACVEDQARLSSFKAIFLSLRSKRPGTQAREAKAGQDARSKGHASAFPEWWHRGASLRITRSGHRPDRFSP